MLLPSARGTGRALAASGGRENQQEKLLRQIRPQQPPPPAGGKREETPGDAASGNPFPRPQIPEFPEFLSVRWSGLKTERHRLHRLPPRSEPTAEDVLGVYSAAFNFQTRGLALLQSLQHFHPHGPSPSRSAAFVCPSLRPLKARPIPQCSGFTLLRNNEAVGCSHGNEGVFGRGVLAGQQRTEPSRCPRYLILIYFGLGELRLKSLLSLLFLPGLSRRRRVRRGASRRFLPSCARRAGLASSVCTEGQC